VANKLVSEVFPTSTTYIQQVRKQTGVISDDGHGQDQATAQKKKTGADRMITLVVDADAGNSQMGMISESREGCCGYLHRPPCLSV
jgi:hypothetical protein